MIVLPAAGASAPRLTTAVTPTQGGFGMALARQGVLRAGPPTTEMAAPRLALQALDRARERLDAVLAAARRGRTFTGQELLALQADAYRYSQAVEVASKVAEQAVQSVKQAVNTQV